MTHFLKLYFIIILCLFGTFYQAQIYCDQNTAPNGTFPASKSGVTPLFTKQLLFFDWTGVNLSSSNTAVSRSVTYNGVTYTATITGYTSTDATTLIGSDIETYISGNGKQEIANYYNVSGINEVLYDSANSAASGTTKSFNVTITAVRNGVSIPVDMVVFDGEATNSTQNEQITFTVKNGSVLNLLEKTGTGQFNTVTNGKTPVTGIGTNVITINATQFSSVNGLFTTTGTAPSVDVKLTQNISKQAVGFAVRLFCDSDSDGIPNSTGFAANSDWDNDNDGILDSVEAYCDTSTPPNGTYPASSSPPTPPQYIKQLLFFDWSNLTLSPANPTATRTVTYNGVAYTAVISGYTSTDNDNNKNSMSGNDANTWGTGPAHMFWKYYNVNTTTFKEVLYTTGFPTGTQTFNVTITARKGSVEYPVNIVVFDPEATAGNERVIYTTNGENFILLEKLGSGTIGSTNITGAGTKTITYINTETSNVNALYSTTGYSPTITASAVTINSKQGLGFAVRLYCDTDNDGVPSLLDTDSDGDGCPDAMEGGDNISYSMLDAAGSINVAADGVTTPVIVDSQGVPVVVNTGSIFNTDGQAQGQTIGSASNAAIDGCFCYKTPVTSAGEDTKHGITSLQRAGASSGNWPMIRKGAYTALEAKTKGFVINRMPSPETTIGVNAVKGMMVFDTDDNGGQGCLKIYDGTAWKCLNTQTCPL